MKRSVLQKHHFTLVELLVSLGVFSIMLVMFMQFFSSTQRVLLDHQKRSDVYASARVAQNFISALVSSAYYSVEYTGDDAAGASGRRFFFSVDKPAASSAPKTDALYFASKGQVDFPGYSPIRFFSLHVPTPEDNSFSSCTDYYYKLVVTVLSDSTSDTAGNQKLYNCCFPEYTKNDESGNPTSFATNQAELFSTLKSKISTADTNADKFRAVLVKNVVDFKIISYGDNGAAFTTTETVNSRPMISLLPWEMEIRLSLLRDDDFEKWCAMKGGINVAETAAAKEFRLTRQLTFNRKIFLGDRWKVESYDEKYP